MYSFHKTLISFLLLLVVGNAHAEKWISVGDGFFYDADSQKRKGDIGTIEIRLYSDSGLFEADCKNKIVLLPTPWKDMKFDATSVISKISEKACVKKYEFWK